MEKKLLAIGAIGLLLMLSGIFIQTQEEQTTTLRYNLGLGNIWRYECITESEHNYTHGECKEIHLRNIKDNFKYEVLEQTPEGYYRVKLSKTPVESKGVSIIDGERSEFHNFVAGYNYEEIILDLKGEVSTLTSYAGGITDTLIFVYENMIPHLRPVMAEGTVGINDTWCYQIAMAPEGIPGMENIALEYPTFVTYTLVAFENKNGFDCAKITYYYNHDFTDEIEEYAQAEGTAADWKKWELKIETKGTIYFAYNEGFMVSRKENLMRTDIQRELINDKWEMQEKSIERIGFTMNYIKP